jgi:ketosteroid isomerase-like protein
MSQENVDLVMRAIRAATKQPKPDFETVNALFHPDHVLVSIMAHQLGSEAEAVGASGYKAWVEAQQDVVSFEVELGGAIDVGPDTVIAVTTTRFRGASSGATSGQRVWAVMTVKDGKITRTESYIDPAEALKAVSLRE